jgi:phosphate transport system ATP-binding protein
MLAMSFSSSNAAGTSAEQKVAARDAKAPAPNPAGSASVSGEKSEARGMKTAKLSAWYGEKLAIRDVDLAFASGQVTAIIGPSGCGKSTLIRCLNRLHELAPNSRVTGQVFLESEDIYGQGVNPVLVRRRIGMVFQRPNPFPTMSIFDNVAAGLRLNGVNPGKSLPDLVFEALDRVALWDEVKDKLRQPGTALSGGQQQRLCIARALAVAPEVLLLDEPTAALDPIATLKIEELLHQLKRDFTVIIVTHNMQQAARVSDVTAFMLAGTDRIGALVEVGPTNTIFTNPSDRRTEEYITGRFG